MHVHSDPDSGDQAPKLTVLESVRCLECGAVYAKPSGGGTVRANPGCPECGYVGWIGSRVRAARTPPRHFDAGRLPHPRG
jgi:hypothetical protein